LIDEICDLDQFVKTILKRVKISDHQQRGYEEGPCKGPEPLLLVVPDFLKRILDT